MDQRELEQSVVEDLLFCHSCASRGAQGTYPHEQTYRYLGRHASKLRAPLAQAVESVVASGMVTRLPGGDLALNPEMLARAQDFSGVYVTIGAVEDDVFDSMLAAGGTELASDIFDDVAADVAKLG